MDLKIIFVVKEKMQFWPVFSRTSDALSFSFVGRHRWHFTSHGCCYESQLLPYITWIKSNKWRQKTSNWLLFYKMMATGIPDIDLTTQVSRLKAYCIVQRDTMVYVDSSVNRWGVYYKVRWPHFAPNSTSYHHRFINFLNPIDTKHTTSSLSNAYQARTTKPVAPIKCSVRSITGSCRGNAEKFYRSTEISSHNGNSLHSSNKSEITIRAIGWSFLEKEFHQLLTTGKLKVRIRQRASFFHLMMMVGMEVFRIKS